MCDRIMFIDTKYSIPRASVSLFSNGHDEIVRFIAANFHPVSIPLTPPYQPLRCMDQPASLSITPGSSFAAHFRNAMLVPPSIQNPSFRLLAGLTEPETHCYEGTMGYADMPHNRIRFNGQVSLIVPTESASGERTTSRMDSQRISFRIINDMNEHVLPSDIFLI